MKESEFLIYETDDGKINIDVILKDETIWSSQKNMAKLFDTGIDNINVHLKNIYDEGELDKNSTIEEISIVQKEGTRNINRKIVFYNLDVIIAVGYRVNSKKATQFRQWATATLNNYITKGFVIDKERLKKGAKLAKVIPANQSDLTDLAYYRTKNIPAIGCFLKKEDTQQSFL